MADTELVEDARRRWNRFFVISLAFFLGLPVCVLAGVLIAEESRSDLGGTALAVMAAAMAPFLIVVAGLVWARHRGVAWLQPPLAYGVDWRTRRRIGLDIKADRPVLDHPEIALDMARRTVRLRWVAHFNLGLAVLLVATRFVNGDPFEALDLVMYASAAVLAGTVPLSLREFAKVQRWLDHYGPGHDD